MSFIDFVDLLARSSIIMSALLTAHGTVCTCGALTPDIARHQADNIAAELVSTGILDRYEMRLGATDQYAPRRASPRHERVMCRGALLVGRALCVRYWASNSGSERIEPVSVMGVRLMTTRSRSARSGRCGR